MAKEINHDDNHRHKKVHSTKGQRKSSCGNWLYMRDGSRFRLTTLPSVATGQTALHDDALDELEAVDALTFQERDA